jgi:hypothetical protein
MTGTGEERERETNPLAGFRVKPGMGEREKNAKDGARFSFEWRQSEASQIASGGKELAMTGTGEG